MSVQASQIRAVRELMQSHRGQRSDGAQAFMPIRRFEPTQPVAGPVGQGALRVVRGERGEETPREADLAMALGDIVLSVAAVDATVVVEHGTELLVGRSVRGLMGRRALARSVAPGLWGAIERGEATWLDDAVGAGVHLPPRAQLLALPFSTGLGRAAAILSFHHRRQLSAADLRFLTHVLTTAASVAPPVTAGDHVATTVDRALAA